MFLYYVYFQLHLWWHLCVGSCIQWVELKNPSNSVANMNMQPPVLTQTCRITTYPSPSVLSVHPTLQNDNITCKVPSLVELSVIFLLGNMAAPADFFSLGSTVWCKTCYNSEVQGEVLAFDPTSKILILSILFESIAYVRSVTCVYKCNVFVPFCFCSIPRVWLINSRSGVRLQVGRWVCRWCFGGGGPLMCPKLVMSLGEMFSGISLFLWLTGCDFLVQTCSQSINVLL